MLKIGTASTVISPPPGANLCGFPNGEKRRNTGVLLDLRAKALALDDGTRKALILTADLIGLNEKLVKQVRDGIAARCGLPADAILVACSHTHSGPYLSAFGNVNTDPAYIAALVEKLVAIGVEAAGKSNGTPVTVGVGTGEVDLCHNRRVLDAEGKSSSGWQDPAHEHKGPVDRHVYVLAFKGADGAVRAVLGSYACHPVVMGPPNMKVSADYPGHMQRYLERAFPGAQAMFVNAGGGNINPYVCLGDDDGEARKMGETLGREVERVTRSLPTAGADTVSVRVFPVEMAPNPRPSEKIKGRGFDPSTPVRAEVQLLRIGRDILIVTAPGELLVEIALRIKAASPFRHTLVFAYANGYFGYLPPPEIAGQGGYEVESSRTHAFEPTVLRVLAEGIPQL